VSREEKQQQAAVWEAVMVVVVLVVSFTGRERSFPDRFSKKVFGSGCFREATSFSRFIDRFHLPALHFLHDQFAVLGKQFDVGILAEMLVRMVAALPEKGRVGVAGHRGSRPGVREMAGQPLFIRGIGLGGCLGDLGLDFLVGVRCIGRADHHQ